MDIMLNPYPTDYIEPAKALLAKVRGDATVTDATAVHAAYQITGAGLGQFYPDKSTSGVGSSPPCQCGPDCCDPEEGMKALEMAAGEGGVRGPLSTLIMQQLVAFALKWLTDYLNK